MKHVIFATLMLLGMFHDSAFGWWNDGKEDTEQVEEDPPAREALTPFDPVYLVNRVEEVIIGDTDTKIRKMDYVMEMKATKGPWGVAYKTKDTYLDLKIRLNMLENLYERPIECVVSMKGGPTITSRDIWITKVSEDRLMYVISFKDTDTVLVIYKPRRTALIAQWVIIDRK